MNEILMNTVTVLALLAGLAALVLWVRRDSYAGAPRPVLPRRTASRTAEVRPERVRPAAHSQRATLVGLSQQ